MRVFKNKKNKMDNACETCGEQMRYIQNFGGEISGRGQLGRHRCRCENNI